MDKVALEGVSKIFAGQVTAVQDLNLTIQDRELVVLVGPSGCGKTTTLRLIAGLEELSHGVIRIDGRAVNQFAARDRNIAMVFQHSALYPHLSVYDNIAFGLRMRHGGSWIGKWWTRARHPAGPDRSMRKEAIAKAVRHASRILSIEHLLERMPRELSGGERQRVALGRVIVRRPAAFLFDEPLSQLDPQARGVMRRQLRQLHQRLGATTVYVTHDQAEAMSLGDRVAVMHHGRIQQMGRPAALYERPANLFVACFLGEPKMNVVRIRGGGYQDSIFVGGGLSMRFVGPQRDRLMHAETAPREAVMGIRPEDIHLVATGSEPNGSARDNQDGNDELSGVAERQRCGWGVITQVQMMGTMSIATVAVEPSDGHKGGQRSGQRSGSGQACEQYVAATNDDGCMELAVTCPTSRAAAVGTRVAIYIDTRKTQVFCALTGHNLLGTGVSGGG